MAGRFPFQTIYQAQISHKLPVELAAQALKKPWLTMKIFQPGQSHSKAPEHYMKFYWEWKRGPRTPVHYIPETGNFKKLPTGEVQQIDDLPVRLMEPKQLHEGIWGGEAVIKGFRKKKSNRRAPRFYVPALQSTVFYSEILDKYLSVVVTRRTLQLVDENYGFDNYILKTPPADLMSELALKIRREMYLTLARGTLYPDNPAKREEIIAKYRDYMIPEEEAEWYGLTLREVGTKLKILEEDVKPVPLKHAFRKEFLEYLINNKEEILEETKEKSTSTSWLTSVNPFAKKD